MKPNNENQWLSDNEGYVAAVTIALVVVATLVTGYYLVARAPPEGYTSISLLDTNGKAVDYPELLVLNQNNTFSVTVTVENHIGKTQAFEIKLKVTNQTDPTFPVETEAKDSYAKTLENGEKWSTPSQTTLDQKGNYMIIYELWTNDESTGQLKFTGNACILNVEVVNQA